MRKMSVGMFALAMALLIGCGKGTDVSTTDLPLLYQDVKDSKITPNNIQGLWAQIGVDRGVAQNLRIMIGTDSVLFSMRCISEDGTTEYRKVSVKATVTNEKISILEEKKDENEKTKCGVEVKKVDYTVKLDGTQATLSAAEREPATLKKIRD